LLEGWTSGIRYVTRRGFLCIKALGMALDPPGLLSDVLQGSKGGKSIKKTVEHEDNDSCRPSISLLFSSWHTFIRAQFMVTTNAQSYLVSLAQTSTASIIHPVTDTIHLSLELYKHSYESAFIFSCLNINRIMLSAHWPSLKTKFILTAENKAEDLQPALHHTTVVWKTIY